MLNALNTETIDALLRRHLDGHNRMMAEAARRPALGHRLRWVAHQHRAVARDLAREAQRRKVAA